MELMFSEYILDQYLSLISDVISWVEEEYEIMSDKGSFKQFMSESSSRWLLDDYGYYFIWLKQGETISK